MEDVKFFVEGIKMRYINFVYVSYFYWLWVDNVLNRIMCVFWVVI